MKITDVLEDINPLFIEDLESDNHYSMYASEDDYQLLILRGLEVSDIELEFVPQGFIIKQNCEIYLYDRSEGNLYKSEIDYDGLISLVSPIYIKNQKIIESYVKELDKLEDSLFERKTSRIFMDIWFDLKKDLSRIERHFSRNHAVLTNFYKENIKNEDFQETEFKDLLDDISVAQHNIMTQVSRLDALYSYYGSIKNDKLNHNIYTLTVLSAIFLPLNLIVGFFGMNTENLFFNGNPSGTNYVLSIVLGSFILSLFGLPFIRFIDNHFLRIFLGRNHIYKKITAKIDKIENILHMR